MRKLQEAQQFFPRPLSDLFRFFLWDCAVAVRSHFISQWWGLWCALQSLTSGWSCWMNRTIWNTMSVHIGTYCGQLLQVFTNATLSFSLFKDLVLLRSQCNLWRGWPKSLQMIPLCATHSLSFNHGALLLSPFPQLFTNLSAFCSDSSLIHKDAMQISIVFIPMCYVT